MARAPALALAALCFACLATANSGGYRFGVSDQAFYEPAIALSVDPTLFPRDRAMLAPQMRLWLGDSLLGWFAGAFRGDLPTTFVVLYGATLILLFAAVVLFVSRLGGGPLTAAACLALVTIRHRITKTGANSLEGYMHPRMLAFACGAAAFAAVLRSRWYVAVTWSVVALVLHTTTGLWFACAVLVAWWWQLPSRRQAVLAAGGVGGAAIGALAWAATTGRLGIMDPEWLQVIAEKDYLFPAQWPVYAWVTNLSYLIVIALILRRRRVRGLAHPGESALFAGLVGLVVLFLASVPLTAFGVVLAVQLQVNRIFWLLDLVALCYAGWWLFDDVGHRWSTTTRRAVLAGVVLVSAGRGVYVVADAGRALVQVDLPATPWTDAMGWLRRQPARWNVLADPSHGLVYGASVRVAAARDTPLDLSKDSALAIYDRGVAMRVAQRTQALAPFSQLTRTEVDALARAYDVDVFVDNVERQFDFPVLYRNEQFVIYRLR